MSVQTLHVYHPRIRAEDWRSPLVRRLLDADEYTDGSCSIQDSYQPARGSADVRQLDLEWTGLADDFRRCLKTYQAHNITEYAALGLACILLTVRAQFEITEVTRRGEKADYWLGDKELMLEVSGQQSGNIDDLCSAKASQLCANPYSKDGFVCVAIFASSEARLWFYSYPSPGSQP